MLATKILDCFDEKLKIEITNGQSFMSKEPPQNLEVCHVHQLIRDRIFDRFKQFHCLVLSKQQYFFGILHLILHLTIRLPGFKFTVNRCWPGWSKCYASGLY